MSLLIKGMEMPTSCYSCMFFAQTDYWNKEDEADILSRCKRTGEKTWESVNGYLPNCPLVEIPPHGDLIGRNPLIDIAMHLRNRAKDEYAKEVIGSVIRYIAEAPTIIPAEEGEA